MMELCCQHKHMKAFFHGDMLRITAAASEYLKVINWTALRLSSSWNSTTVGVRPCIDHTLHSGFYFLRNGEADVSPQSCPLCFELM